MKQKRNLQVFGIIFLVTILWLGFLPNHIFAREISAIYINGIRTTLQTAPIIVRGTTFVPLRNISEQLGFKVSYNASTKAVEMKESSSKKNIFISEKTYTVNGLKKDLNPAAFTRGGVTFVPLRALADALDLEISWDASSRSVSIEKYRIVNVSNATEFLNNMKSYTKIILTKPTYNLTEAFDISNPSIRTENTFDGYEHIIENVHHIIIEAKEGVNPSLLVSPRYSNVLPFQNCQHIRIKNITAGHTIEWGYCEGGVIKLINSSDFEIENCKLYGCGTYGIIAEMSSDFSVKKSEIYECTYGCIDLNRCKNAEFSSCIFRDCQEFSMFNFNGCVNVTINNSMIKNNRSSSEFSPFISTYDSKRIEFKNCKFLNNTYTDLLNGKNIQFTDCNL